MGSALISATPLHRRVSSLRGLSHDHFDSYLDENQTYEPIFLDILDEPGDLPAMEWGNEPLNTPCKRKFQASSVSDVEEELQDRRVKKARPRRFKALSYDTVRYVGSITSVS